MQSQTVCECERGSSIILISNPELYVFYGTRLTAYTFWPHLQAYPIYLPFAFTILHGSGASMTGMWMQTEGKNRGGLERRLCISSMKSSSLVPRLPCSGTQTLKLCRLPTGSYNTYLFSGSGKPGNKIYKQSI